MQQEEAKSSAFWYEYDDHQEYSTAEMILAAGVIPIIMPAQAGLNPNWNNLRRWMLRLSFTSNSNYSTWTATAMHHLLAIKT
jgi:hypothetical protein